MWLNYFEDKFYLHIVAKNILSMKYCNFNIFVGKQFFSMTERCTCLLKTKAHVKVAIKKKDKCITLILATTIFWGGEESVMMHQSM